MKFDIGFRLKINVAMIQSQSTFLCYCNSKFCNHNLNLNVILIKTHNHKSNRNLIMKIIYNCKCNRLLSCIIDSKYGILKFLSQLSEIPRAKKMVAYHDEIESYRKSLEMIYHFV